ncbi:MAG: PTS sugar transporter subunit IIA [Desulfovibrionaceae bacterium]|jgi:PTS system mannose-specific IIA component|nr:PTS sugar transporter subunit IIA [Desulfovibrionaceae bacterium]
MAQKKNDQDARVGVVLATHTDYGARLIEAAAFIVGPQPECRAVGVDGALEVEETLQRLQRAVSEAESGAGVIILTDMFGGTPTNLSLSLLSKGNLEVVTGVNLPMLLKVLGSRDKPLPQVAGEARDAGLAGIVVAGELLRSRIADKARDGKAKEKK